MQDLTFFSSPGELNGWFQKNAGRAKELWIGFYRVSSGRKGLTYKEAVDEALCFGWIDGIRKTIDGERYTSRFSPRKKNSTWSNVNTKRMQELMEAGRVHSAGLAAFRERDEKRSGIYSFEQKAQQLLPAYEKKFRANTKAWKYFSSKAPWYRRTAVHWVMSAKQERTRLKRLETLINDSENERTIAPLTRDSGK